MYLLWSQMEEAWRDTLVHKAEGYAFRKISELYGFPWPEDEVSEKAWRGALHVEALGRRGTYWATFQALEAAFSDFNEAFSVEIDPADPYMLRRTDGNDFAAHHFGRLLRTPYGLFFTVPLSSAKTADYIEVSPYSTRYWDAPAYDVATYTVAEMPVEMLPFLVYERGPGPIVENSDELFEGAPCLLEISLIPEALATVFPPTWLQEEATAYDVTLALSGSAVFTSTGETIPNGTFIQLSRDGVGTLPEPFVETDTYVVANSGSFTVELEALPGGGGSIVRTTAGTAAYRLVIAPDPDMEIGGHLLEDENVEGNNDAGGPYPVYLYDGDMFPSLQAAIQATLPSGVHVRVALHPVI